MLAFAPLPDETNFTSQNHLEFVALVMAEFGLKKDNLVCLIGDNCSTNNKTADLFKIPSLGCRSHRFNLAMEKFIDQELKREVEMVTQLMGKLSTLKEAGFLRQKTHLRPVKRNVTRWLGVIHMMDRFLTLLPSIDENRPGIADFIPSAAQRSKIRNYQKILYELKAVTLALQSTSLTLAESEELFQSVITEFPQFNFSSYLGSTASIVHNVVFERAIIKVQCGNDSQLLLAEAQSIKKLEVKAEVENEQADDRVLSIVEGAMKRQKLKTKIPTYVDTRFLIPTTNHVERLFSMGKRVFSSKRRSLLPRTLEALVFLKQNCKFWDVNLVSALVNETPHINEADLPDYPDTDDEFSEYDLYYSDNESRGRERDNLTYEDV